MVDRSVARSLKHRPGADRDAPRRLRLLVAQMNAVVGDIEGNGARILAALDRGRAAGADVVVFPELALCGYPPDDLLLRPSFVAAARGGGPPRAANAE